MNPLSNNSDFGITHLWTSGDTITHLIAILLVFMSITSWFFLITKFLYLRKMWPLVKEVSAFWQQTSWQNGLNQFSQTNINPFYQLASGALRVLQEHQTALGAIQPSVSLSQHMTTGDWLSSAMKSELDAIILKLQSGLAFLASTGATSPFIGLFGTVWGIYHALMVIGTSGSASLDQVAGPIGEALVMTALGLVVAIPAVLAYNALNKLNRELINTLKHFADDLHTFMLTTSPDKRSANGV